MVVLVSDWRLEVEFFVVGSASSTTYVEIEQLPPSDRTDTKE